MTSCLLPALPEIRDTFAREVTELEGSVMDTYDDGNALFLRATFPQSKCVRPLDSVNRGVALRANAQDVEVHPYIYRQVCRNGAVMAETTASLKIARVEPSVEFDEVTGVLEDIRAAVCASASERVFGRLAEGMRRSTNIPGEVDLLISMAAMFSGTEMQKTMLDLFLRGFAQSGDRTRFGVANVVTAVARDTRDQETRWRLEELGGGIFARLSPAPTPLDTPATVGCC